MAIGWTLADWMPAEVFMPKLSPGASRSAASTVSKAITPPMAPPPMAEDSRLAVDRWTGATLPQASAHRVPARSKKPALRRHHGKRLAEGDLYLWEPHQLRFRRASWSVEEDEHEA